MAESSAGLEALAGYAFRNRELLQRALTHKSRANENAPGVEQDNEQLEFLGDSILGFVVSDQLVRAYPEQAEGRLSKTKSQLVSASHLHLVAQELNLGDYLRLGRGEELSGGRTKKTLLADAVEALLAAIYLDGGIQPARQFVVRHVLSDRSAIDDNPVASTDHKSALQELTQALRLPQPRYAIVEEHGPEHAKTFLVEARVGREFITRADGLSKKSASQKAAHELLAKINASRTG